MKPAMKHPKKRKNTEKMFFQLDRLNFENVSMDSERTSLTLIFQDKRNYKAFGNELTEIGTRYEIV